jgi:uncharacterized protein with NRDE domain
MLVSIGGHQFQSIQFTNAVIGNRGGSNGKYLTVIDNQIAISNYPEPIWSSREFYVFNFAGTMTLQNNDNVTIQPYVNQQMIFDGMNLFFYDDNNIWYLKIENESLIVTKVSVTEYLQLQTSFLTLS